MLTFNSCHLLFDHFQFALIHGPDIPGSYAIFLFTASDLASITSHIHSWYCFCFGSIPSFFLELFVHWSPVAYWAATDLWSSSFSILSFCLFILFMGFSRQEYWSSLPLQVSLSITKSQSLLKLMSIESMMWSNHLILCHPLLLPPSIIPIIRVFLKWVNSLHEVAK